MFETEQICPYTGLRAFTEEESLYFKGREEHIDQATEQLQRNKFLMLTGASGDGKSSLIYAGIIPNARAGFLRSKYTQWLVADFRPERSPFQNLCRSIAKQLGIKNTNTVEAELNHGFSAIIDLYKNSKRYLDTNSAAWQNADEKGRAALKREAANLIILVDQFEEFFTNPENYHKGVPSSEASLVLNLLLETSRIALEEDLPIYTVFTMRSDFIGQCAAFRGLPEYIGFSQFFVPRLNRTQLQQVIEEPAVLSGNRITRRLTERLIHDLTEGVDQLPILQHALNQVWHAADNGREEMDLIHYAMVGGMPVAELPAEQVERFNNWFEQLAPEIKACYHEPNLQNVLDTHTNKLYERAAEYYNKKTSRQMPDEDAKAIVRTVFICLTKIDQSRAVRNRMTLGEITNIFGHPQYNSQDLAAVIDIFREPGNTFIRPFIDPEQPDRKLEENDVLDITHESLIRNWEYLGHWAREEYDNYTISLDFEQQLNRWVESDKSNGFLLSIGPLTYFENWFNKAKPNAHWLARYLPEEIEEDKKLDRAVQILDNSNEFLKRSARKHMVTRTVMKYGTKKIAAILGLIAILTLSSFAVRNYFLRQNSYVLKTVKEKAMELANNDKLSLEFSIPLITVQMMNEGLSIREVVNNIKDTAEKIRIATGIATQIVAQGWNQPQEEIREGLNIADSLMGLYFFKDKQLSARLKMYHDYAVTARLAYYFDPSAINDSFVTRNSRRSTALALQILEERPADFNDIQFLTLALLEGLNKNILNTGQVQWIIKLLSPFDKETQDPWVAERFAKDKVLIRGQNVYGPAFNGLYQQLAYFYAATGEVDRTLRCVDSLLHYSQHFYGNDYASFVENASHIAAVYYSYGKQDSLDAFVKGYCERKKLSTQEFYSRLVSVMMMDRNTGYNLKFFAGAGGQELSNLNVKLCTDDMLKFFFDRLKKEISAIQDKDESNFEMAVALKNEGVLLAAREERRGKKGAGDPYFREALKYYELVGENELNNTIKVSTSAAGTDMGELPNNFLFLYPDYRVPFHPFEPRSSAVIFNTGAFINYLLDAGEFDKVYKTDQDLKYFELWLSDYNAETSIRSWAMKPQLSLELMEKLLAKLESRHIEQNVDVNLLYLHASKLAFENKQPAKGLAYIEKISTGKLLNTLQYKNQDFVNIFSFEMIAIAVANAAENNNYPLVSKLIDAFKKNANRSSLYGYASQYLSLKRAPSGYAQRLLDSSIAEMKRVTNSTIFQPNKVQVALALMFLDPIKNNRQAQQVIKNSLDKFNGLARFGEAFAFHNKLYDAYLTIPPLVSSADRAYILMTIIRGYNALHGIDPKWKIFNENELIFNRIFLPYVNENQ